MPEKSSQRRKRPGLLFREGARGFCCPRPGEPWRPGSAFHAREKLCVHRAQGEGKTYESSQLIENGAAEIDLMPNVGFLVKEAGQVLVKIMLELPLLSREQQERAVLLNVDAGVACLKNASGGTVGVATPEQIAFLRRLAPPQVGILPAAMPDSTEY